MLQASTMPYSFGPDRIRWPTRTEGSCFACSDAFSGDMHSAWLPWIHATAGLSATLQIKHTFPSSNTVFPEYINADTLLTLHFLVQNLVVPGVSNPSADQKVITSYTTASQSSSLAGWLGCCRGRGTTAAPLRAFWLAASLLGMTTAWHLTAKHYVQSSTSLVPSLPSGPLSDVRGRP